MQEEGFDNIIDDVDFKIQTFCKSFILTQCRYLLKNNHLDGASINLVIRNTDSRFTWGKLFPHLEEFDEKFVCSDFRQTQFKACRQQLVALG